MEKSHEKEGQKPKLGNIDYKRVVISSAILKVCLAVVVGKKQAQ